MATDLSRLQGEVSEHPETDDMTVQKLMIGFLRALLQEQRPDVTPVYLHPTAVNWKEIEHEGRFG